MTTANPICILNSMNIDDCSYPLYPSDKFDCTLNTDNAYITPINMCALIDCSKCADVFSVELFTSNLQVLTINNNVPLYVNFYIKYVKFLYSISEKIAEYDNNYQLFTSCLVDKYNEMVDEFCAEFEVSDEACVLFKNLYDNIQPTLDRLNSDLAETLDYLAEIIE
jgi:hypothetical protein